MHGSVVDHEQAKPEPGQARHGAPREVHARREIAPRTATRRPERHGQTLLHGRPPRGGNTSWAQARVTCESSSPDRHVRRPGGITRHARSVADHRTLPTATPSLGSGRQKCTLPPDSGAISEALYARRATLAAWRRLEATWPKHEKDGRHGQNTSIRRRRPMTPRDRTIRHVAERHRVESFRNNATTKLERHARGRGAPRRQTAATPALPTATLPEFTKTANKAPQGRPGRPDGSVLFGVREFELGHFDAVSGGLKPCLDARIAPGTPAGRCDPLTVPGPRKVETLGHGLPKLVYDPWEPCNEPFAHEPGAGHVELDHQSVQHRQTGWP